MQTHHVHVVVYHVNSVETNHGIITIRTIILKLSHRPKGGGSGHHVFRPSDLTIIPVIAYDQLSKSIFNAPIIWGLLA